MTRQSLRRRAAHTFWRRAALRPVLRELSVHQHGHTVQVHAVLAPRTQAYAFWAHREDSDEWTRLREVPVAAGGELDLTVDVQDLIVASGPAPVEDREKDEAEQDPAVIGLFLEVQRPFWPDHEDADDLARSPGAELSGGGAHQMVRYRAPLGGAERTTSDGLATCEVDGGAATLYLSAGGQLNVTLSQVRAYGEVYVGLLRNDAGVLRLRGRLCTRSRELEEVELLVKGRLSGQRAVLPVQIEPDERRSARRYGQYWYRFSARASWRQLLEAGLLEDDVFDLWAVLRLAGLDTPHEVRVGKTRFLARRLTSAGSVHSGDRAAVVTPYYTYRAKRTTFQIDLFDAATLRYLRRAVRWRWLLRMAHRRRDIWVVGERPYKAQDTGYAFFRYLRLHQPQVEAYYVIDRDSPERSNVEPFGNVLDFGSKEHIRTVLLARKVLGSHHPDFLYPLRTVPFRRAVRATKVFLQHGVMGTKWLVPMYGKSVSAFDTDLFVVSSEREKQYIVSDFGYSPNDVIVTGLSRFDALLAQDVPVVPGQVLIMPTWRDWLQDPDTYPGSEYHERWSELLRHPRLARLAAEHGLTFVLCLHPNMQQYRELFDDVPARVVSQGEVDVQLLLKQSALLVTDYSSVGFDFSFLHKPVLYFQFDRERFIGPTGSHLELDDELPGPVARTTDELLAAFGEQAARGLVMDEEYVHRADRFIAHRDLASSERIYHAVRDHHPGRRGLRGLSRQQLLRPVEQQLRQRGWYFPLMRQMLKVLRRLPADPNTVLFESGVGRQYADSPRYLYEELVRRDSPLRKVWAYSGRLPVTDQRTSVVDRLSPAYFWHLGRARYWVNNQSFPHYVRRRPDGVYVQTWHGTPLKRMLHDLDQITGRDRGYVQRATDAAQQWSLLVSPSSFATSAIRSAFQYQGPAIEVGYPRNDVLLGAGREELAARVRRRLAIPPEAKVVLYAPTFRDDQTSSGGRFTFALPLDLKRWHEQLGPNVVLLLRMHVLVRNALDIPPELAHVVRDVSTYPEIQELFLASDVLVTDYSSVFFDFAALRRPMLFYAYDLDRYRDDLRGFYLDYGPDLPGPVLRTEDELLTAIEQVDELSERYAERYDAFLQRFAPHDDGHAAARVVDHVFGPVPEPPTAG